MQYLRTLSGVSAILFGAAPSHLTVEFAAAALSIVISNPPWPYGNQLYQAEALLYESSDIGGRGLNCIPNRQGTTPSAQWVRIAYHDMANHNVEDGTGGLDASIRLELDRAENIGRGMADSLEDFSFSQSPYLSMADLIAMGVILGYAMCGGPNQAHIPYRVGRVDATTAGPPGVPQPHQDLQSHIDNFKRQGFTQTEMITLVACGHSLGGVRKVDFPTIVASDQDFELFNGIGVRGFQEYDRRVVTAYLNNTTPNPLVVTPNVTMQSDLRIFGSDGNATMQRLSTASVFDAECASLIERMINTVPKDVTLTDPIPLIELKVGKARLFPSNDSDTLKLVTTLRTLDTNPNRKVTLHWTDREGTKTCLETGCSAESTKNERLDQLGTGFLTFNIPASMYHFEATINATTSIGKFWFEIDEGDGSATKVIDNHGQRYEIDQDDVLFDPVRSGKLTPSSPKGPDAMLTVAVKTSRATSISPRLITFSPSQASSPQHIPKRGIIDLALNLNLPPTAGYTFFSGGINDSFTSWDVVFDGKVAQEWVEYREIQSIIQRTE